MPRAALCMGHIYFLFFVFIFLRFLGDLGKKRLTPNTLSYLCTDSINSPSVGHRL